MISQKAIGDGEIALIITNARDCARYLIINGSSTLCKKRLGWALCIHYVQP